jgi:hypothetical protein
MNNYIVDFIEILNNNSKEDYYFKEDVSYSGNRDYLFKISFNNKKYKLKLTYDGGDAKSVLKIKTKYFYKKVFKTTDNSIHYRLEKFILAYKDKIKAYTENYIQKAIENDSQVLRNSKLKTILNEENS